MIDVELWYFLYCGSGHVDLEGALDRFYFISLLEEGELSRSTQLSGSPGRWVPSSQLVCYYLLPSAVCARSTTLRCVIMRSLRWRLSSCWALHMHRVVLLGIFHCVLTYCRWKICTICTPLVNVVSGEWLFQGHLDSSLISSPEQVLSGGIAMVVTGDWNLCWWTPYIVRPMYCSVRFPSSDPFLVVVNQETVFSVFLIHPHVSSSSSKMSLCYDFCF